MKTVFLLLLFVNICYSQGDCPSSASQITECGITYTGNNAPFTDNCGGDKCGCVGGGSNPSNFDNDCSTAYVGGNCGSDFMGSIENSMWWRFTPIEDCDYIIDVTAYNCCCSKGNSLEFMQVWIGQMSGGSVTSYLVNDNANTTLANGNTVSYTVPVSVADGDVFIMLDGNAGTECDIDLEIRPSSNCFNTCPILLDNDVYNFRGRSVGGLNKIEWNIESSDNSSYTLQKSYDAMEWSDLQTYPKIDGFKSHTDVSTEITYYRLIGAVTTEIIAVSGLRSEQLEVDKYISPSGFEINNIESYFGVYIVRYKNGVHVKKVK